MSKQEDTSSSQIQPPTINEKGAWKKSWKDQSQEWRTERQKFLAQHRAKTPNIEKGNYPFKDIKLNHDDVKWLLETHENGRGPVDWSDEMQHEREGLDLRGADLQGADLKGLMLTRMRGGLIPAEWENLSPELREMAAIHLEGAYLEGAHLEDAKLGRAYLGEANLFKAHLQQAVLHSAHLEGVNLYGAYLEGADLRRAFFDTTTVLERATLSNVEGSVKVADVRWNSVNLAVVEWKHGKNGVRGRREKYLVLGDESRLHDSKKPGKRLHYFNAAIRANNQVSLALRDQGLNDAAAYYAYRAQFLRRKALWWQAVTGAVDMPENLREKEGKDTVDMPENLREKEGKDAVQIGLWQRGSKLAAYVFSGFLAALSGYGYKPIRCLIAYVSLILLFALAHFFIGHGASINEFINSIFISIQAFHGRPFSSFSLIPSPSNPYIVLESLEAIVGLLIEALIVAIFTQRILGM